MSVVAVRVDEDGIHIASDSIRVRGWTQEKVPFGKLFKVKELVIGAVGSAEETGLLRIFLQTHMPKEATEDDLLTLIAEFHEWVYKRLDNHKYEFGNRYFVVVDKSVFYVHGYFIQKISRYEAIGAGEEFALAAMALGLSPSQAIIAACEHSIYCELPVNEFFIPFESEA